MITKDDVIARTFAFLRTDGTELAHQLELLPNGTISGAGHPNETFWDITPDGLAFLNENGIATTLFSRTQQRGGQTIFFGTYCPSGSTQIVHMLWEWGSSSPSIQAAIEHRLVKHIDRRIHDLGQTLNLVARKLPPPTRRPVRVLFLVHAIETWDSLMDIYEAMRAAPDFEPIVATLPRNYHGEKCIFEGELANHEGLRRLGVAHIRPAAELSETGEAENALDIVKAVSPDIIFRQSPWDADFPAAFCAAALGFARLCYVPYYGFNLLEHYNVKGDHCDLYADQGFHRLCWRIYAESDVTARRMQMGSARGGDNVVVAGHPKLDRLWNARERPAWPIVAADGVRRFRVIWAPHHSIRGNWLGFGRFLQSYEAMLEWARQDANVEIVLKPHPALFAKLRDEPGLLDRFLHDWRVLPNTALVEGGDYGPLLAGSDAMLTDGISFLAEYQLFAKPLVFLDSAHHSPFNAIGLEMLKAVCRVDDVASARVFLDEFRRTGNDPAAPARSDIIKTLLPYPGQAAQRVLEDLRAGLSIEG